MLPLTDMSTEESHNIKAILFDLDGTFVNSDELKSKAYSSLETIREKGLKTIAVTGRPAGWCDLIARWWPCLLYTSPSPRDRSLSRMPSSA